MDQLKLDQESIQDMKTFYQEERHRIAKRLQHIDSVLAQMGIVMEGAEYTSVTPIARTTRAVRRKYKKKRGPKSKWDKAILKTLRQAGKPLTYNEITNFLMISEKREPQQLAATKAAVQNTIFKLRNTDKVRTFSMGARIKYIGMIEWFDANGTIQDEYKSLVVVPKKPEKPGPKPAKRGPGRPRKNPVKAESTEGKKPTARKVAAKKSGVKKATQKKAAAKKTVTNKKTTATKSTAKKTATKGRTRKVAVSKKVKK